MSTENEIVSMPVRALFDSDVDKSTFGVGVYGVSMPVRALF